jgi:glycosyltransferase involved in cell wall biosynthesis
MMELIRVGKFKVHLVVLSDTEAELQIPLRSPALTIHRLGASNLLDFRSLFKLKAIFNSDFCRVHNQTRIYIANLYWSQIWTSLVKRKSDQVIWVEHNTYESRTHLQWLAFRLLQKRTGVLVAVSSSVQEFLLQKKIASKVVHNPVDIQDLWMERRTYSSFVLAGRLNSQKNPFLALNAFHRALSSLRIGESSILYIAGEGPLKADLEKYVETHALQANVFFTGFLNREELQRLMASSHVLLSTSRIEGFSLVRIEALAHGMCVVTTRTAGWSDTLRVGEYSTFPQGVFVVAEDVESVIEGMVECLSPVNWQEENVTMRRNLASPFGSANVASQYLNLLGLKNEF